MTSTNTCIILIVLLQALMCQGPYKISDNFSIQGTITNDKIQFSITYNTWGWVGINFSNTMTNSDMIVSVLSQTESVDVLDCYSKKWGIPAQDTSLVGGKDNIMNKSTIVSNNITTVTFERLLNTKDFYDKVINLEKPMLISLAWLPNAPLSYHGKDNHADFLLSYDKQTRHLIFTKQDGEQ